MLFISQLLDTAKANLAAGGTTFPFVMPSGFKVNGNFTTPDSLRLFANALQGKIELYRVLMAGHTYATKLGSAAQAITDLNASYLNASASNQTQLAVGPYNQYSSASGETVNPLSDNLIYLAPTLTDSIQAGDHRASQFIAIPKTSRSSVDSTGFKATETNPATQLTAPNPILKNSELILLRAQAEIEVGPGSYAAALADINVVRTIDGGLAPRVLPVAGTVKDSLISYVLYEKRYSLLLEGPQRFVDLRAYLHAIPLGLVNNPYAGKANGNLLELRKGALPSDPFQAAIAIPIAEQNARGGAPIVPVCP
jgi:hypothetical protein